MLTLDSTSTTDFVDNFRGGDGALRVAVERLIARTCTRGRSERRSEVRHADPRLVKVTPVDKTGTTQQGPAVTVVGKHVSQGGWGFFHTSPLPCRYVIAEFENTSGSISILVNLIWCRFLREGWYDSGGRFLRVISDAGKMPANPKHEFPVN